MYPTISGLDEPDLCIGDVVRIGDAELEATLPRLPCFKPGFRFGGPRMVKAFAQSRRWGIYFRISKEGRIAPGGNRALFTRFLATLPVLGLDGASVQVFGEAKALLGRQGQRLADSALFIGAIAVVRRATVVTGNRRHYERIPGVTVESWIRG